MTQQDRPKGQDPDRLDLTLRRASESDSAFLLAVYSSTRQEELAPLGWTDSQKAAFLDMQFTAQRRHYEAAFPGSQQSVILLGDQPVGRIWIARSQEEIRLLDIALLPDSRGRGIGTALISDLVEEARASGRPLRHMVLAENTAAQRLYSRLGLSVAGDAGVYLLMELNPAPAAPSDG